ncbi:hypothetical protein L861_12560 [Litchfieldella anticariensis FP35 = DSM 16096]|uniref:Isochorismatase-like domain-containing protein n=1 Tax=Litchfieldella anticariensis (strain DSM 16096 / CECT 5854 / CIP 108499 / LMG 22089 / FP35) TaxID=1121939 RepID=S2KH44_LITA3|nr:cysteine hydrolase family protein [Halomonas anticariensis]EPC01397.1 hypothetical protein L861_12560 [Halomonas anticariensis FP35 = DSM 16096]
MASHTGNARLRLGDARDEGAALMIVDVQRAIDDTRYWGERNNIGMEDNLEELLAYWRGGNGHIVHVRHFSRTPGSPYRPGQFGAEFKDCVMPRQGERVVTKHVSSAFVGTDLENWLRHHGVSRLVVAGVATAHAVSTTVRHAGCLDFAVTVAADACASFAVSDRRGQQWDAEQVHALSLAVLDSAFADISTTHDIVQNF